MTTITGSCAVCGHSFTSTDHQRPRRRYCSTRCRKIAWRGRRPRSRPTAVPRAGDVTHPVPRPADLPQPVPGLVELAHLVAGAGTESRPSTRCPHCAQPVAVINLLVAPAAAQIPTPRPHDGWIPPTSLQDGHTNA
jgi:endogenous inhibitor of DNA gyrase (YacG/DUF329 family)